MVSIHMAEPMEFIDIVRNGVWNGFPCKRLYVRACNTEFLFFYIDNDGERILIVPYRVLEVCEKAVYKAVKKLMN